MQKCFKIVVSITSNPRHGIDLRLTRKTPISHPNIGIAAMSFPSMCSSHVIPTGICGEHGIYGCVFSEVKCFAFDEVKRSQTQAPLRESQAFIPCHGRPLPRVLAVARAPYPVESRRAQFCLFLLLFIIFDPFMCMFFSFYVSLQQ
jgi:hypothetical protein